MSDAHHAEHGHEPEPREISHALLWTAGLVVACGTLYWLFFHCLAIGRQHAAGERIEFEVKGPGEPDHQALIAARGPDVLDRGAVVYGKNCASCHGPQGDAGKNGARNFLKDAWRNPQGGGPYALYLVITKGYNSMPAFPSLTPEDRYAVDHYVRETMVKPKNPSAYVENDPATMVATIPAPGSGGGAEQAEVDPVAVQPPKTLHPLMKALATEAAPEVRDLQAWLARARQGAGAAEPGVTRLQAIAARRPHVVLGLRDAVAKDDRARFVRLLAVEAGAGTADPTFSLMPEPDIAAVFAALRRAGDSQGAQ